MGDARAIPTVGEYRLALDLDFAALTFTGTLEADLTNVEGTVVLDAVELEIQSVTGPTGPVEWELQSDQEELVLRNLPTPAATVRVEFRGRATTAGLMGLYRSKYGDGYILTTQCAPTDACRIFPCIDRPDRKAPIRFTITTPKGLRVIFNTPAETESTDGGRTTQHFASTPPMATYLFYLAVGSFDRFEGPPGRVRVTAFTPPGRAAAGEFGARHAAALVPAFEEYYGIPYPLPKLDLIAVPEFAYGAMENWGAISFRELQFLVDGSTSTRMKRLALDTIAHEIAHQWFGNLVTMEWWTDLWLNESFATFLEMRMVERIDPSYGSLDNFLSYWTNRTLLADSLATTHPVTAEVTHPSQIAQSFDEISYGKGASVLRMIDAYLGEETFRAGVADYLRRFQGGNARSADLWEALDRAAQQPVRPMLEQWLNRPGLPVISVREAPGGLELRQRRFFLNGAHAEEQWPIPVVARLNGELRRFRFDTPTMHVDVPELKSLDLNPNAAGFYRVLYDGPCYDRVLRDFPNAGAPDQWAVVQDLFAFLMSGDVDLDRFAEFVRASESVTGYLPVREVAEGLSSLHRIIGNHPKIVDAARSFLQGQYRRLGAARRMGEPETDGVLRERVATALLWFDPGFAHELASRFSDVPHLDPDLRPAVSLAFARTGGADAYVALRRAAEAAPSEGEALEYEVALASSRDPALVEATYQLLDEGVLNRAHLPQIVRPAAHNPEGRAVTWAWMTRRLEAVGRESRGTGFASYVYEYALPYVGLDHPEDVTKWVAMHPVIEGDRGARKGLALLDGTRALRTRFGVH